MRFEDMFAKTIVVTVVALLAGSAIVQAQSKTDVTGKWALEVTTQAGGTTMPEVTLKQEGEKLTGHYTSQVLGDATVTGTIKGQQIELSFNVEVQGFGLHVIYTGTVDGNTMKGKISLGELGDGTFTGKKQ
jgi:preprotein translocase subunit SecD